MNSAVDEKIKVAYGNGKIELVVTGFWRNGIIWNPKVKHGEEYISPIKYGSLFFTAVHIAERMHRAYLEDQQERKAAIIYRILGY